MSEAPAQVHLVMFDIDGTLVDSDEFDGALYAQAVQSVLGADVDTTWSSYENVTDSGILEEILARKNHAADDLRETRALVKRRFLDLTDRYLSRDPGVIREIPGAKALVETLLAMPRVRVAVATGGWPETAMLKLRRIGLDPEPFAVATSADSVERTEIMRIAERRALGPAPASRRTYFGDGPWDKKASLELGYDFVAVGRRVAHDLAFENLGDLGAILEQLGL